MSTTPSLRLHHLYILRSQIDLLIAMEEGVLLPDGTPACQHPEDRRVPSHNMGEAPSFYCQECKTFVQVRM